MAHRKQKETKQQPGTAGPGYILGCCLASLRFLCDIHSVLYSWFQTLYERTFLRKVLENRANLRRETVLRPLGFSCVYFRLNWFLVSFFLACLAEEAKK